MQSTLCSHCKKNLAVIFITKIENGETINEGLCLKCAKQLGIKPIDDMMKRMGVTEEDLETMTEEMMGLLDSAESERSTSEEDSEEEEEMSRTATFPFLSKLFGGGDSQLPQPAEPPKGPEKTEKQEKPERAEKRRDKKKKFLDTYCLNLTQKARDKGLDQIVGREMETERVVQILNRRQKNNPCLIGEPGVGKTAIAEGLAQMIVRGDVPYKLRDRKSVV